MVMSDREEIIERAVEYAYYDDIITFDEVVEVLGEDEAEGMKYLAETVEQGTDVPEPDGEVSEEYRDVVESAPFPTEDDVKEGIDTPSMDEYLDENQELEEL